MKSMLFSLRVAIIGLLASPLIALAAPQFLTIGGISLAQDPGTPIITILGNGTSRWVTTVTWTNNNAFATNHLYFVVTQQWDGQPINANALQWDNTAGVFESMDGNVAEADNEAFYVPLDDTDIALPSPIFGVAASDSLAAFFIGSLAAGASTTTDINFVITSTVNTMFFNGSIVQAVPEPQSLALTSLALLALSAMRRRSART